MTTHADIHGVKLGTGYEIFKTTILPAIEAATSEVILITCFWAQSQTRDALNNSLLKLSSSALQRGQKVQVRIGFSSSGVLQKLLHTSSPDGYSYQPSEWSKLGLPSQETLGGLELEVKSMFFLPFSVWHPKFVCVDRALVLLPSCNVSWEDWFEGCVEMSGPIVPSFIEFWKSNWRQGQNEGSGNTPVADSDSAALLARAVQQSGVSCKFLPSPHHRNPNFRLPWQQCAPPPPTPLNMHLLEMLATAKTSIYMQTPNVTCTPVLDALLAALKRGINVRITTSERLMILEQLVTAGTTTSRCIKRLIQQHQQLLQAPQDEEAGLVKPGRLLISYYEPRSVRSPVEAEPVQSHLKLTIVDDSVVVFGSGNMDRASWYTSQELGVAFYSEELVSKTIPMLQAALEGRTKLVYGST